MNWPFVSRTRYDTELAAAKADADRLLAEQRAEKERADRLQARLDAAVGLKPGQITGSRQWQPGYQKEEEATW